MIKATFWGGTPPTTCNLCHHSLASCFIDGSTRSGQWALMCCSCHEDFGCGLGVGRGQIYFKVNNLWQKLQGDILTRFKNLDKHRSMGAISEADYVLGVADVILLLIREQELSQQETSK